MTAIACALTVASACGDPLVDEQYRGEALWSHEVNSVRGGGMPRGKSFRAALFFQPTLDTVEPDQMIELRASTLTITPPSSDILRVYELPGPAYMLHGSDGASLGWALARFFVYDDLDHDGVRGPSEPIVGGQFGLAFAYFPTARSAGQGPAAVALPAGFVVLPIPQPCGQTAPPPTTDGDCGVPLGNGCSTDADCGMGGMCLHETSYVWPGGYCVVPDRPTTACRPGGGAYVFVPPRGAVPLGARAVWGRRCATNADCVRGAHAADLLYGCEPSLLACVPAGGGPAAVTGSFGRDPFCAGPAPWSH